MLTATFVMTLLFYGNMAVTISYAAEQSEQVMQYTCGMHPMIVVDEPGLCPICQMDLTSLKQGSNGSGSSSQIIEIDPVTSQKMGIRTAVVKRRDLARRVHTVGVVDYKEPGQHAINCKMDGWVEKLYVNETGQNVMKGQPLLDLYSPQLVTAQQELLLAIKNLKAMNDSGFPAAKEDAENLLTAARKRLLLWDISQEQIDRLEATGQVQKTLTIHAPYSGVVSKKQVRDGDFVRTGKELLEISDLSEVWIYAYIYEYEIPWVKIGQQVKSTFPFASAPVMGRISTIYPYLDKRSRTIKARIDLDNSGLNLKPDMYADIEIFTDPVKGVISIPSESILYSGKQERIFIDLGDGRFEPREIEIGVQDESGYIEILSGVDAGEKVVTSAQFMLDSESKLREALHKMLAPKPKEDSESLEELF
jgi:Cu(I)/Ag(I) efflux system membrane fusion protein/cobalt-zinc-cadmium efflux system membrane fusion protein